jgi:alpha-beta hydrolase superfamily lysophospholipase
MTTVAPTSTPIGGARQRAGLRIAFGLTVFAGLLYFGALAILFVSQERLLFPATPLPATHRFQFPVPFREVGIPVPGATLSALHFTQPDPRGLVFFLHGNAGNLETWTTGVEFYRRVNYDLFIVDYRGYGKSTGHIESEAQLHADVRAAWDAIAPRYRDKPIVIYGRSLGTGLATRLARDVDPALLILVTPYTSIVAAAQRRYPFVPAALVKYPLRTDAIIGAVKSPILFAHGTDDTLIPLASSVQLQALARAPTELLTIEGAGHHDIHRFPAYVDPLAARLIGTTAR